MKIGIGIPSAGAWQSYTGLCLASMVGYFERQVKIEGEKPELELISITGHLPQVRHMVIGQAVKAEVTHLLWIDADMVFPPDTIVRLLNHNLPIVGANYSRRTIPPIPTAYRVGEYADQRDGMVFTRPDSTGLEEVKHVGMGVCLTDMRVFDAIDPPYFMFEAAKNPLETRGEDVYFCEKLREAGIPAYVDHDLSQKVMHVGEFLFTHEFCNTWDERSAAVKAGFGLEAA